MKSATIIWLVFFVLLSVQGNALEQPEEYTDPSRPIEVKVGQTFIIVLECNKARGLCWKVAKPLDKNILEYVNSRYEPDPTMILGAVGKEKLIFKANGSGKIVLQLNYAAPYEKYNPPEKKRRFIVIVR